MKRKMEIVLEVDDAQYYSVFDQIWWYLGTLSLKDYAVFLDAGSNKEIEQ